MEPVLNLSCCLHVANMLIVAVGHNTPVLGKVVGTHVAGSTDPTRQV